MMTIDDEDIWLIGFKANGKVRIWQCELTDAEPNSMRRKRDKLSPLIVTCYRFPNPRAQK
jgi:hypothetical protein